MHIRVDDYKVSPIVNPKNVPQPLYIFMHITVDGYEVSLLYLWSFKIERVLITLTLKFDIQYSQETYSVINHCDIFFALFNLFTFSLVHFG
jgi:hypothetical protein